MHTRPAAPRTGFTLIEMLIVIAIIAVLVALSSGAVLKTIDWQHRTNTRSELNKVHGEVTKQWSATIDTARGEPVPASVTSMAGGDATRARAIWIKLRLRQEFPMSYAEARNPGAVGGTQVIPVADLKGKYPELQGRAAANDPESESAACLLMALKKKRRGTGFSVEEALGSGGMKDTDGDGIPEVIDSWGTPVKFYRWGTEHPDLNAAGDPATGALARDKEDPDHALMSSAWDAAAPQGVAMFQALCHPVRYGNAAGSRYTEPTIASAGPNRRFGLVGPNMAVNNAPDESDNLYSFRLR